MWIVVTQKDAMHGWVKQTGSIVGSKLRKDPSEEIEAMMVRLVF